MIYESIDKGPAYLISEFESILDSECKVFITSLWKNFVFEYLKCFRLKEMGM